MTRRPASLRPLRTVPRTPDGHVDIDRVVAAVASATSSESGCPRLLESVPGMPATGRWSYVVAGVRGRMLWWPSGGLSADGVLAELADPGRQDPLHAVSEACDLLALTPHGPSDPAAPPFTGGLIGGLAYDLARTIERVPDRAVDDRTLPWIDLAVADLVLAVDHQDDRVVLVERSAGPARDPDEVDAVVQAVARAPALADPPVVGARDAPTASTSLSRPDYLLAVRAILDHIAAGDTFQVNLSQRLTARWPDDVLALYRALRTASPAPYGAVVPAGRHTIASISPETFLHVDSGRATVRPIKGTRPRHPDPDEDLRLRDELAASEKDRAENVMVVDMERNDLGRVCVAGSVEVPRLCAVEAHPTVWHLVSEVSGRLRPDTDYGALLRATFPCGSVTGAPKVKALELIDRYEPVRRGWYCGAIGFLGEGAASLSVAIRTATLAPDGDVDYGAGGGIVADSDPAAEHEESLVKAAAFLQAVGAAAPRLG